MSDSVDRILDLIDEGLLDAERQHTTEPAMMLDPIVTATGRVLTEEEIADWVEEAEEGYDVGRLRPRNGMPYFTSGATRVHVCVPECHDDRHIASTPMSRAVSYVDAVEESLLRHPDEERVYVRLHTSEPHTPDDGWISLGGAITGFVIVDGQGRVCASGELE